MKFLSPKNVVPRFIGENTMFLINQGNTIFIFEKSCFEKPSHGNAVPVERNLIPAFCFWPLELNHNPDLKDVCSADILPATGA